MKIFTNEKINKFIEVMWWTNATIYISQWYVGVSMTNIFHVQYDITRCKTAALKSICKAKIAKLIFYDKKIYQDPLRVICKDNWSFFNEVY